MVRHGGSDVRVGVLSLSARSPEGLDARYLEWHALDHLPEHTGSPGCAPVRVGLLAAPFVTVVPWAWDSALPV